MNSLELIKILVDKVAEYEARVPDSNGLSIEGFLEMNAHEQDVQKLKNSFITGANEDHRHSPLNIERVIAQHLLFMYRYVKFYSKMIFQDTIIKSLEEFSFMTTVLQYGSISKSELIKKNIYEKSSGIEMINRLIKMHIFVQYDNPNDMRSQLIELTEQGKGILYQVFAKMNTLGIIAAGELSQSEKITLANLLKKLDNFHYNNYNNKQRQKLEDYLPE